MTWGTLMMDFDFGALDGFELFWDPAFPISSDEAELEVIEPVKFVESNHDELEYEN